MSIPFTFLLVERLLNQNLDSANNENQWQVNKQRKKRFRTSLGSDYVKAHVPISAEQTVNENDIAPQ